MPGNRIDHTQRCKCITLMPGGKSHRLLKEWVVNISFLRWVRSIESISIIRVQREPIGQALRQVWVRNEPSSEDNEVSVAGIELGYSVVSVVSTSGDELNAALAKDATEGAEVVGFGLGGCFCFDTLLGGVSRESVEFCLLVKDFVEAGFDPARMLVSSPLLLR